jgi:hypothetical protein
MSWSEIKKAINSDISVPLNELITNSITSAKNTLNTAITNSVSSNKTNVLNAVTTKVSKSKNLNIIYTPSTTRSDILRVTGSGVLYGLWAYTNDSGSKACQVTCTIDGTDLFSDIGIYGSSNYGCIQLYIKTEYEINTSTSIHWFNFGAPLLFEKSLVITGINSTGNSSCSLRGNCIYKLL